MNRKFIALFIIAAHCALLFSCLIPYEANKWLNSQKGVPAIDITGGWDSGNMFGGGWGGASIVQNGSEIVGRMAFK